MILKISNIKETCREICREKRVHEFSYLIYSISSVILGRIYKVKKVIDIGCGIGLGTRILKDSGFEALGIDIDEKAIEKCREKNLSCEKADFCRSEDVEKIIKKYGLFDASTLIEVTEHISLFKLIYCLKNLYKLLEKNGILILSTPNKYYYDIYACTKDHVSELAPEHMEKMLRNSGFKVIGTFYSGHISKLLLKLAYTKNLAIRVGYKCKTDVIRNPRKKIQRTILLAFLDKRWINYSVIKILKKLKIIGDSTACMLLCQYNITYFSKIKKKDGSLMYLTIAVKR